VSIRAKFEERLMALAIEEAEQKVRAATATAERAELEREYVFEVTAREIGREAAMRVLSRVRLVEVPTVPGLGGGGLKGVPKG
jgi:hypothetical protein